MLGGPIQFHGYTLQYKAPPGKRFFAGGKGETLYHFTGTVIFFPNLLW
jgi:hypothetical protein